MTINTAFVTGAASGIGLALVHALLKRGLNVVAADIDSVALDRAIDRLAIGGGRLLPIPLDVTDRAAFAAARTKVLDHFGGIQLLFNNAGVGGSASIDAAGYADWDWVLGVNLGGVINGLVTFLPDLIAQGAGHIINTASITALVPQPGPVALYSVSKQAVLALSETLHWTLAGSGVHVSVVCPGFVRTNIAHSEANRQDKFASALPPDHEMEARFDQLLGHGLEADVVATDILRAIDEVHLYVFTHPEFRPAMRQRFGALLDAVPPAGAVSAERQQAVDAMLADLVARA